MVKALKPHCPVAKVDKGKKKKRL